MLKSPLRYPGGKSRAVSILMRHLPPHVKVLCSPFLGGGSFELACVSRGIKVRGYDSFAPLINFWEVLLSNPKGLSRNTLVYHPLGLINFKYVQALYSESWPVLEKASIFYALNRSSFSGTTFSGGMSKGHPRFTESGIRNLASFRAENLSVKRLDFRQSLEENQEHFLYCDPPYMMDNHLYGMRSRTSEPFDHKALSVILKAREHWMLSYNDCKGIREMYAGHRIITLRWAYGMGTNKKSNEILIFGDK